MEALPCHPEIKGKNEDRIEESRQPFQEQTLYLEGFFFSLGQNRTCSLR
jgi:hypothetical protein